MQPEYLSKSMLSVSVPRGIAGYWDIILQLHDSQGHFTVPQVHARTSESDARTVRKYVFALEAAGFVARISGAPRHQPRRMKGRREPIVFRLLKRQRETPAVRRDGTILPPSAEQRMWTAMRGLASFSIVELCFAATVDGQPRVTDWSAYAFVNRLAKAGYLAVLRPPCGMTPGQWRLKPSMNSGPLRPRKLRIACEAMWDQNLRRVVGEIITGEPQP